MRNMLSNASMKPSLINALLVRLIATGPKQIPVPRAPKSTVSRISPSQKSAYPRKPNDVPTLAVVAQLQQMNHENAIFDLGYTKTDLDVEADRLRLLDCLQNDGNCSTVTPGNQTQTRDAGKDATNKNDNKKVEQVMWRQMSTTMSRVSL